MPMGDPAGYLPRVKRARKRGKLHTFGKTGGSLAPPTASVPKRKGFVPMPQRKGGTGNRARLYEQRLRDLQRRSKGAKRGIR